MTKKIFLVFMLLLLIVSVSGCFFLIGGAAGGAGAAVWLSGKLSYEVNAPFERTVEAAKDALESFKFKIEKETTTHEVAQLISKYSDGRQIWIDVHRAAPDKSRVEVRVGAAGDKGASQQILERIQRYL